MVARPDFPWEYPVPENAFWSPLPYSLSRNFFQAFTEPELSHMTFDPSLPQNEKLNLLSKHLNDKLSSQDKALAPRHLYEVDNKAWQRVMVARISIERELGNEEAGDEILYEVLEKIDDKSNMWGVSMLADVRVRQERYEEAERMWKEQVLPWMRSHGALGENSPQVLGVMRRLVDSAKKQGKDEEAQKLVVETMALINGMSGGKFAVYQEEERRALAELVDSLGLRENEA